MTVSYFPVPSPSQLPSLDLALVSMPFGPLFLPSIGLGLLKAGVEKRGVRVKDFYFTLPMAERIGTHLYLNISNGTNSTFDLLGEWIFSDSVFGPDPARERGYIEDVLRGGSPAHRKDGTYQGSSVLTEISLDRYIRSENVGNKKSRGPTKILETRHDTSDEFTKMIRASDEGVYEVVSIKDRFCSYTKPSHKFSASGGSGTGGQKRLTY